jgi:L-ribulose-5-phosphate 3-epimerase
MPQYGIAAWCVDSASAGQDVFDAVALQGLASVHFAVDTADAVARLAQPAWRAAVQRRCRETGVRISCLALNIAERTPLCGSSADANSRRWFHDVVLAALEFAAEAKVPIVYVPSFGLAEITSNDDLREMADLLARAAESARSLGIEVASENSLGAESTERLIEYVDQENFRILFDIYNPRRWGHCPTEIIKSSFAAFATQIHIKDGRLPGYGNAPLGAGDGEIVEIVQNLLRRGFDGIFVLENGYGKVSGLDVKSDLETLRLICDRSQLNAARGPALIDGGQHADS